MRRIILGSSVAAIALAAALQLNAAQPTTDSSSSSATATATTDRCGALRTVAAGGIESAAARPAAGGTPAHCEIIGSLDRRTGADGQAYAIRYHLRLPDAWNGRFFFQGGGGTNGNLGDALGMIAPGSPNALARGYAVVSQDSGHSNERNSRDDAGGQTAFGADPQARANYGHAGLKRTADVAKALVATFYGKPIERSYFVGCSKGGQEGMAFAQRYPDEFDGIVAAAPGFSLPRAALAQVWDVQTFGSLSPRSGDGHVAFGALPGAFSDAQLARVRTAVLAGCDQLDGLADGIVGRFDRCSWARVAPKLAAATCADDKGASGCLSTAQVAALRRSLAGPTVAGKALYASWPWDGGVGSDGWRLWKLGSARMPGLNILTGGPAMAMMFSTPPAPIRADPQSMIDYEMAFDFARQAGTIYATTPAFPRSSWDDNNARSPDLAAFAARGGKMIVPHGVSDPVFSINDTLNWYREVEGRTRGGAARFVRVFPVPGMAHCGGGPATSSYDAFAALVDWVEHGKAPDRIIATAPANTPWPGRKRPLCPYPQVARYTGKGSIEDAASFVCTA